MKGSAARYFAPVPVLGLLLLLLLVLVWALWIQPAGPPYRASPTAALEVGASAYSLASAPASPRPTATPALPAVTDWYFQRAAARLVSPTPYPDEDPLLRPTPVPGGSDVNPISLSDALVLTFDRPVTCGGALPGIIPVPQTVVRRAVLDERTLAFTPDPGWRPDTDYSVRVTGAQGAVELSFRTRALVRARFPFGSEGMRTTVAVELYFDEPADTASVEAALQLDPATPHRLRWAGLRLLVLEPEGGWAPDTTYTIALGAEARTATGIPLAEAQQWTFSTRSGVLATSPRGGALPCSPITVDFDRPVDPASLEAAWHITPSVAGTFEWQDQQVRFIPVDRLKVNTSYEVCLDPLRAIDGSLLLRNPLCWRFTPQPSTAWLSFGYGPNVQILDAAGPRLVQFAKWGDPGLCGDFVLYQVPPERLLADYSSSFKGEAPISIDGLLIARQWTEADPRREVALPADLSPGLYVLTTSGSTGQGDRLLIVLTHYTLILKEAGLGLGTTAEHQVSGYASSISSGQPRPGMTVRLYDRSGRMFGLASTDTEGRFETTVYGDTDPLLALGEVDGEVTLCGFGQEWNAQGGWWDWRGWLTDPPTGHRFRVYAYTDRPIYRPGQTVYVKAFVRSDDDALYAVPAEGTAVTVRLRDARDNVIGTEVLQTSAFGSVYTAFTLAEGGTLGTYHVEAVVGEEVTRQALKVEEYRKPDYEVTVRADRERYLTSEEILLTVEARYYLGQPVAGAPVSLDIYGQSHDEWECGWGASGCWVRFSPQSRKGTTDAEGRWQVRLPAESAQPAWWSAEQSKLSFEATVEDGSEQSVSSHVVVQVHRQREGVSLFLDRYVYGPGEDIPVEAVVLDYQGKPVSGVPLRVGLYPYDGQAYGLPLAEVEATTDGAGVARAFLRVDHQGWFLLRVTGPGQAEGWVCVFDPASTAPWGGQIGALQVDADKPAYAVGETANLLVRSPVTGTALLTLERGTVRRMQLVHLSGPVTTVPVTVEADFAPNLFATVQVFRLVNREEWNHWGSSSIPDVELLLDSAELVVPVYERRLQVTITSEREVYAPREEASVVLQITDATGRPVRAELSLAVVDEAIYALSQDLALDPFEAFYQRRQNLVRTYHSLKPVREIGGAEMGGGGGGADLGNPRRHFPDTAYWSPAIVTDENGRALVTVPLPDSLTRWRLVARAVAADTLVGEGTAAITVSQPLVVRPALPRFLVQGDTFTLTASVHNYSGDEVSAEAGLQAEGLAVQSPLLYPFGIAAGETVRAAWPLQVTSLGMVTVTAYARAAGLSDAVQHTLPVVPFAVPEVSSWAGEFVGEHVERFTLPADYIAEVTQLEVRLAPTVVPTLLDGLEYLIGYPFG